MECLFPIPPEEEEEEEKEEEEEEEQEVEEEEEAKEHIQHQWSACSRLPACLVKDGRRNPRKIISSQTGATNDTTTT